MTCPDSVDRHGPDNSQARPLSRATRYAITAGPLTPLVLDQRCAEAARRAEHLFQVLREAELLHLLLILKTLPPGATWREAAAAMRQVGA